MNTRSSGRLGSTAANFNTLILISSFILSLELNCSFRVHRFLCKSSKAEAIQRIVVQMLWSLAQRCFDLFSLFSSFDILYKPVDYWKAHCTCIGPKSALRDQCLFRNAIQLLKKSLWTWDTLAQSSLWTSSASHHLHISGYGQTDCPNLIWIQADIW